MLNSDMHVSISGCAPVLLLGFNRPDKMRALIDAVRVAKPARLYVAVDGPRSGRVGEDEKCRAVQECIRLVDWPCEVKTLFRERNLGCKLAVSGAISWFFENEECGIILEDDIRPSKSFFRFVTEMLERYKDDERVGAVCGFNHFNLQSDAAASYHFSSHFDRWGWATWRRAWRDFRVDMKPYAENYREIIDGTNFTPYFKRMLKKEITCCFRGSINSWAYPFLLHFLAHRWLQVVPKVRLVANGGFDDRNATHTGGYLYYAKEYANVGDVELPYVHPDSPVCDEKADRRREQMEGAIFPRGLTWLGCKFPALCPFLSALGQMAERVVPFLFRL